MFAHGVPTSGGKCFILTVFWKEDILDHLMCGNFSICVSPQKSCQFGPELVGFFPYVTRFAKLSWAVSIRREDGEDENMEEWDQDKLESVVKQKHGAETVPNKTNIICKFFLDAVENRQYGWFWQCPNGKDCKYRHALPPGYVLKSQMKVRLYVSVGAQTGNVSLYNVCCSLQLLSVPLPCMCKPTGPCWLGSCLLAGVLACVPVQCETSEVARSLAMGDDCLPVGRNWPCYEVSLSQGCTCHYDIIHARRSPSSKVLLALLKDLR
jgi:hypothetical protein